MQNTEKPPAPSNRAPGPDTVETLSLHAEALSVAHRRVETALVRAVRSTHLRDVPIAEELAHEDVEVTRVAIGRVVDAVPPVREEGDTTILPVVEEVLVLERRLVLKEEVHLRRVRTTRIHAQTVQLREQDVTITRTSLATSGGDVPPDEHPAPTIPTPPLQNLKDLPMSEETIVAVFDTAAHAEAAVQDLRTAQVPADAISSHAAAGTTTDAATPAGGGFWASLFGGEPDHDTSVYDRSMAAGSTVVTVKVPQEHVTRVTGLLEAHHPVDLDERAAEYGLSPVPHPDTSPLPHPDTMPRAGTADVVAPAKGGLVSGNVDSLQLSAEELAVGKRVVNRGGTRIRRFVVETPVEQQVTLHDETVTLERHPVTDGRAVDATAAFTDKTIEMTETREEAVVAKTARVVEEIALRKQGTEHVETVRDTLRREDVAIEQIPGETTASTTGSMTTVTPRPKV